MDAPSTGESDGPLPIHPGDENDPEREIYAQNLIRKLHSIGENLAELRKALELLAMEREFRLKIDSDFIVW